MKYPDEKKLKEWIDQNYQLDHLHRALEYVTNWDIAIDCGAHVGTWSIEMAKKFEVVHAFEPVPATYECLKQNAAICGNVAIYPYAVLNYIRDIGIKNDKGFSSVSSHIDMSKDNLFATSIDSEKFKKVGFIKLDVEGSEPLALIGAVDTIMRDKPVILIEEKYEKRYGFKPGFIERFLGELKYEQVEKVKQDGIYTYRK